MSYDVTLAQDGKPVTVERFQEGGTQPIGGETKATLNITGNYSIVYQLVFFRIEDLRGRRACDTIARLRQLIDDKLGTMQDKNHWAPTPGNAGHALSILLAWAVQHPDAVWEVT